MRIPDMVGVARRPQPALGGSLVRPRPMLPVQFALPGGSATRTSLLDTGADDTVGRPEWRDPHILAQAWRLGQEGVK